MKLHLMPAYLKKMVQAHEGLRLVALSEAEDVRGEAVGMRRREEVQLTLHLHLSTPFLHNTFGSREFATSGNQNVGSGHKSICDLRPHPKHRPPLRGPTMLLAGWYGAI